MKVRQLPWSKAEMALLRVLVARGLTARQIQQRFPSRTRNAVIGACHRFGLQLHHKPLHLDPRWRNNQPPAAKAPEAAMPPFGKTTPGKTPSRPRNGPQPEPAPVHPHPVIHTEAAEWQCRWPVSKPTHDMLVCGERKANGYSYCMHHCRIAFHGWRNLTPAVNVGDRGGGR
jgi:hypothetical protein